MTQMNKFDRFVYRFDGVVWAAVILVFLNSPGFASLLLAIIAVSILAYLRDMGKARA